MELMEIGMRLCGKKKNLEETEFTKCSKCLKCGSVMWEKNYCVICNVTEEVNRSKKHESI